jgi:mRNA interferase MazF
MTKPGSEAESSGPTARRRLPCESRPNPGAEIRKTQPPLILQNDLSNRNSPITTVAAITSQSEEPLYPTEVFVTASEGGLTIHSVVLLNQLRSIDTQRLVRRLGRLSSETMRLVDRALLISLGLAGL